MAGVRGAILGRVATSTPPQLQQDYEQAIGGAALVDRSERGKLALTGSEAASFLHGQVSNDIESLPPGDGCYAAFLTPKGKMLGDLRVLAVAGDAAVGAGGAAVGAVGAGGAAGATGPTAGGDGIELLIDTERVALQALFDTLRLHRIGFDTELHKRTLQRGLLSLLGPRADGTVIAAARDGRAPGPTEHANVQVTIAGHEVLAIRTDLGIDVLCLAEDTEAVRDALLEHGAAAIGEEAAEVVRVERGRPRYGLDLDDSVIPQEADLNPRAVSFTKGCYVGQETVARLFYRGKPNRHLRGLRLDGEAATGDELRLEDRVVGTLGSRVTSPALGPIGLAIVRREAQPGAQVSVGERGAGALVTELPFDRGE